MTTINSQQIVNYCLDTFKDIAISDSWGERGVFYNKDAQLKRGVYVLTIKEKDGRNDSASNLNRDNVYSVNIGLRTDTFKKFFARIPKRQPAGQIADIDCDFSELDKIMPHPVYAWMGWIRVINPSEQTFETLKPLIKEAYEFSIEKFNKKVKNYQL